MGGLKFRKSDRKLRSRIADFDKMMANWSKEASQGLCSQGFKKPGSEKK